MCESAAGRGQDSVIRKTLDAQYRYTVGLAPLYRAPRKYCSMKKCCCPCVSPCLVPFHPSIPSRLSQAVDRARALLLFLAPMFVLSGEIRCIRMNRTRRVRSTMLFFSPSLTHPLRLSLSLSLPFRSMRDFVLGECSRTRESRNRRKNNRLAFCRRYSRRQYSLIDPR